MEKYIPENMNITKYLFFTGKGGVGKTSTACATAVALADSGKKVMLVSTDPASNLQDVFAMPLTNKGTPIPEVPGLTVANFDPISAAKEYMESVVGPYRGLLPDSAIANMEEQLMGSCTVEIASFNEFAGFLTNPEAEASYDYYHLRHRPYRAHVKDAAAAVRLEFLPRREYDGRFLHGPAVRPGRQEGNVQASGGNIGRRR